MNIEKINTKFRRFGQFVVNHRIIVMIAFAALLAFSVAGLKRIYFETSFDTYFVKDDPMILKTNEFKSIFGNDYYVAVLVENKEGLFNKKNLELVRELSNELMDSLSLERSNAEGSQITWKIASLACKAAVKGNTVLSQEEALSLLDQLRQCQDPYNCPHGRPTIVSFTRYELDKRFKRIQD